MSLRKICTYPCEKLREETKTVEKFDEKLNSLIADMWETMYSSDGVGLAAPQIGVAKKVVIIDYEGQKHTLINPVILEKEGSCTREEGCLSFPGIYVSVESPEKIKACYQDKYGDFHTENIDGFLACIFSHEIDHLSGRLLIDRVSPLKRQFLKKRIAKNACMECEK